MESKMVFKWSGVLLIDTNSVFVIPEHQLIRLVKLPLVPNSSCNSGSHMQKLNTEVTLLCGTAPLLPVLESLSV